MRFKFLLGIQGYSVRWPDKQQMDITKAYSVYKLLPFLNNIFLLFSGNLDLDIYYYFGFDLLIESRRHIVALSVK